jgi:DinB family protein
MDLETMRDEYTLARQYTLSLYDDLDESTVMWRPSYQGSSIGWHLGHEAAVNHYVLRNWVNRDGSIDHAFDRIFDAATDEIGRTFLPPLGEIVAYREIVAARTIQRIDEILSGDCRAPDQMRRIGMTMLAGLINHEYQHDCWVAEVRQTLGHGTPPAPLSSNPCLIECDGYWVMDLTLSATPAGAEVP